MISHSLSCMAIQDQKSYSIAATLGSIVRSTEKSFRFKSNTRVFVGDYAFNDESLEDNLTSAPTALEINLPVDDDYMGIRRSLWSSTDKVYRDAARHFQRHQQTLKGKWQNFIGYSTSFICKRNSRQTHLDIDAHIHLINQNGSRN